MSRSSRWTAHHRDRDWRCEAPSPEARRFHQSMDGYAATRLVELPGIAAETGLGRVFAKDESARLGLPAFKALGASWAIRRILDQHPPEVRLTLVTATDGNHGRAVARFAADLGHDALVFVPRGVPEQALAAIAGEGARVARIDGDYDQAVAAAAGATDAEGDRVLVQDTAWAGYRQVPEWIVEGYGTLLDEVDGQLAETGTGAPDLVLVPTGVGSLLQAVIAHYRSRPEPARTAVVAVEPTSAACVAPSLAAGRPVTVPTAETTMAGLNCGTPSELAWPYLAGGLDAVIEVSDDESAVAGADLAVQGVAAGPCGAAPLAALRVALTEDRELRTRHLGLTSDSVVVLLVTEGLPTVT